MPSTLSSVGAAAASAMISLWRRSEAACTLNRHSETDLRRPVLPRRDRRRSAAPAAANAAAMFALETRREVRRVTAAGAGPWPPQCSVIVVSTVRRHIIAIRWWTWPEVVDQKRLQHDDRRGAPALSPCWLQTMRSPQQQVACRISRISVARSSSRALQPCRTSADRVDYRHQRTLLLSFVLCPPVFRDTATSKYAQSVEILYATETSREQQLTPSYYTVSHKKHPRHF